jgi:hypothetical protein
VIHVVMRLLSLILVVSALMMMGGDVIASLEKHELAVRSFTQLWQLIDKHSADAFVAWIERDLPAFLAHGIEVTFALPAWAVTGVPGVVLAFLFGRRAGP